MTLIVALNAIVGIVAILSDLGFSNMVDNSLEWQHSAIEFNHLYSVQNFVEHFETQVLALKLLVPEFLGIFGREYVEGYEDYCGGETSECCDS